MVRISFAQNQEDIMLWRALQHIDHGFYIDVGAADPIEFSVTKLFYDFGWHGINLEPQSAYFSKVNATRPHDINLQLAAGSKAGYHIFYRIDGTGLSTFDAKIAAQHKVNGWEVVEETIETLTLSEICQRHRPHGPIHFLKVDVEGAEGDVLTGADFKKFRPWIVLVEATLPLSQEESYDWESILTLQGYSFVWFDGLNRFYLADEKKDELGRYFVIQPNVFDDFEAPVRIWQRAEHAEEALREARAASHQMLKSVEESARDAATSNRNASTTMQQMQHIMRMFNETSQRSNITIARQAKQIEEAHHKVSEADRRVTAMLRSTSWRVTRPLRMAHCIKPNKQLARVGFRRSVSLLLRLPGGRFGIQLLRAVAPRPAEWFACRYRAYLMMAQTPQETSQIPPWIRPISASDMSQEEDRMYGYLSGTTPSSAAS